MNPWPRFWPSPTGDKPDTNTATEAAAQQPERGPHGMAAWLSPHAIAEQQRVWWQQAAEATAAWWRYWSLALPPLPSPVGTGLQDLEAAAAHPLTEPAATGPTASAAEPPPEAVPLAATVADAFDLPDGDAQGANGADKPPAPRQRQRSRSAPKAAKAAKPAAARKKPVGKSARSS